MTDDEDVTMEQEDRYRMLRMKEWRVCTSQHCPLTGYSRFFLLRAKSS